MNMKRRLAALAFVWVACACASAGVWSCAAVQPLLKPALGALIPMAGDLLEKLILDEYGVEADKGSNESACVRSRPDPEAFNEDYEDDDIRWTYITCRGHPVAN